MEQPKRIYAKISPSLHSDTCWICGRTFYNEMELVKHNVKVHENIEDLWWHKMDEETRC